MKMSGVYKITNTITGDCYIGSSKDIKKRWTAHKCPSTWKNCTSNIMYQDMQKYGLDKFEFEIIAEVEIEQLKKTEQQFIETLQPTYNDRNAKGRDIERKKEYNKEYQKEYRKSEKYKEYEKTDRRKKCKKEYYKSDKFKEYQKEYRKSDKFKEYQKEYYKSDKGKESLKKAQNKYQNQLCCYNVEILTLGTLSKRFQRAGIPHPTIEAKKYLLNKSKDK